MIRIIYVSSCCSPTRFEQLRGSGTTRKLPQAQKYHQLLIDGFSKNEGVDIVAVSAYPTNRNWSKKVVFKGDKDTFEGIDFHYVSFLNLPLLSQLSKYFSAKKTIKQLIKSDIPTFVVCDALNQSLSNAAISVGKRKNISVMGIVTDVPGYTSGARRRTYNWLRRKFYSFAEKKAQKHVTKFDLYLFLTELMNNVVNVHKRPYLVIEGQADIKMASLSPSTKAEPKIAMYAGGIHKEFGIERMVNAFLDAHVPGWELHIYGDGNYQKQLTEIGERCPNIFYHGVVSNEVIVSKQLEATILVNPRLTDAEYVKYSFPSKTMECMASGTPLLTTKLPGMPKEYFSHVFFFEDESEKGMTEAFERVLGMDEKDLFAKGLDAKDFILKEKNNVIQAKKIKDFLVEYGNK